MDVEFKKDLLTWGGWIAETETKADVEPELELGLLQGTTADDKVSATDVILEDDWHGLLFTLLLLLRVPLAGAGAAVVEVEWHPNVSLLLDSLTLLLILFKLSLPVFAATQASAKVSIALWKSILFQIYNVSQLAQC